MFGDVGQLVADLDVAPGIEIALERVLEFRLGGPGVAELERHVDRIQAPVPGAGELEAGNSHLAAVELVADLAAAARRLGDGADEVVVVVEEVDALEAQRPAVVTRARLDVQAVFLVGRAARCGRVVALVHAREQAPFLRYAVQRADARNYDARRILAHAARALAPRRIVRRIIPPLHLDVLEAHSGRQYPVAGANLGVHEQ